MFLRNLDPGLRGGGDRYRYGRYLSRKTRKTSVTIGEVEQEDILSGELHYSTCMYS